MASYVVTGAGRGLGYAFGKHLSSDSRNTVIGLVRDQDAAKHRAHSDGLTNVHYIAAQVSSLTGGKLDVLINNAAYIDRALEYNSMIDYADPTSFEKDMQMSFQVNVTGVAHTINAFLPLIYQGSQKKVIVVSSGMADAAFVSEYDIAVSGPYAMSKAAVNMLVAKYHVAVGNPKGVLFLAISPGSVATGETEPNEEALVGLQAMVDKFKGYAPHFQGPIPPAESVDKQMTVINSATVESLGGQFVSHYGNQQWL